ncbi:MAG: hypothetical protein ACTHNP_04480 [Solirubrobacterales bacterium]
MAAQDDVREREMRTLFNLTRPEEFGRADIDAVLELEGAAVPPQFDGMDIPFELKSATKGRPNISTVRDFGLHYIEKWRSLHWLFGVYNQAGGELKLQYCLYGSPKQMKPWFDRMAAYIAPDIVLAETVPDLLHDETLSAVLSEAADFEYEDAYQLMKNQYKRQDYRDAADLPGERYSREAMLAMLRERCCYVIKRGSTLNNPHISASYFDGWERIERNHAARLRELVIEALEG